MIQDVAEPIPIPLLPLLEVGIQPSKDEEELLTLFRSDSGHVAGVGRPAGGPGLSSQLFQLSENLFLQSTSNGTSQLIPDRGSRLIGVVVYSFGLVDG